MSDLHHSPGGSGRLGPLHSLKNSLRRKSSRTSSTTSVRRSNTPETPTTNRAKSAQSPVTNTSAANGVSGNAPNNIPSPPGPPGSPINPKPAGMSRYFSARSLDRTTVRRQYGGRLRVMSAPEAGLALENKTAVESDAGFSRVVIDLTCADFTALIKSERLASLPQRESRWDRVLTRAQYFAEQLHKVDTTFRSLAFDSHVAANSGYGHAWDLIKLGPENSEALDKAFALFCKYSLTISLLLSRSGAPAITPDVHEQLRMMYADLLALVSEVGIRFHRSANSTQSSPVCFDVPEAFGEITEASLTRRARVTAAIWNYHIQKEGPGRDMSPKAETFGRWLDVQDPVLSLLNRDHSTFAHYEVEYTCLWFYKKYLSDFVNSKDSLLLVNGGVGSGKTVLAASIADTLQLPHPISRRAFSTLFCSINASIPSQANSTTVVKSLLYQLFDLSVGNMHTYRALVHAFEQSKHTHDTSEYEENLWEALRTALRYPMDDANELIIVIDGFDELAGHQEAPQKLLDKLFEVTKQGERVQLVAFSQSLSMPPQAQGKAIVITAEDIREDIGRVASKTLQNCGHFRMIENREKQDIIGRIVGAAEGSFLWAIIACELLNLQKPQEFLKSLEKLSEVQHSVQPLILRLLSGLGLNDDAKTLLSWLATAERPFKLSEIKALFDIDVHRCMISNSSVNIQDILQLLRPILFVHQHIVRFRHGAIQTSLQTIIDGGEISMPTKDGHMALIMRALAFLKWALPANKEPTLEDVDQVFVDRLFDQHPFLEYAVRYWVFHAQKFAVVGKSPIEFNVTREISGVFAETAILPLIEKFCWEGYPAPQALELHAIVERLRCQILTENHRAVLQTVLTCAWYHVMLSERTEASQYYYRSTKISLVVLGDHHPLTIECANCFLRVTEGMEVPNKEEILGIVVAAHETIPPKGHDHLDVVLGEERPDRIIKPYKALLFPGRDDNKLTALDISLVTIKLDEARASGNTSLAEQIYVTLWQEVSAYCCDDRPIKWHQKNIEIMLQYSKFLRDCNREDEAAAILTCLWLEYKNHCTSFSESIVPHVVGAIEVMKGLNLYTLALSVLKHANSFYTDVQSEESQSYSDIQREIVVIAIEFVKQSLATFPLTEDGGVESESMYRDAFLFVIPIVPLGADCAPITLFKMLVSHYIKRRKWQEAIYISKLTLRRAWDILWSESLHDGTVKETLLQRSAELTERLAECYIKQNQPEKAEGVYVELFRAMLRLRRVEGDLFNKAKSLLTEFYRKYECHDKIISILQEVFAAYHSSLGPSHETTIKTLYELGSLCRAREGNHPYWIEYYQQVVSRLNKDSEPCPASAIEAVDVITNYYWDSQRYAEAVTLFGLLWNAFVQKKEYGKFGESKFVIMIYDHYFHCLENTSAKWEVLHKVADEYRKACKQSFSATPTIPMEATLALARVCQRNEKYIYHAIALYEKASKSDSPLSTSLTEIEQTLLLLYTQHIVLKPSANISSETLGHATESFELQFSKSKSKYGYSHELTLSYLCGLSALYFRQHKANIAVNELTRAILEIITKETSSLKLIKAAASIAKAFYACSQAKRCKELSQELHQKFNGRDSGNVSEFSLKLEECSRLPAIFPAALEHYNTASPADNSAKTPADVKVAIIHYDILMRMIKEEDDLDSILTAAAPLRRLLKSKEQQYIVKALYSEICTLFKKGEASKLPLLSKDSPHIFIVAILERMSSSEVADLVRSVIVAANDQIKVLIKEKNFVATYDVAECVFQFALKRKGFSGGNTPGQDSKLASLLAGLDGEKCSESLWKILGQGFKLASLLVGLEGEKCPDESLRKQMLQLSKKITAEIRKSCEVIKINFARVQLQELNQLVILLGKQEDYTFLDWLLNKLWETRDAQPSWPPQVLLNIGRHLACVRFLAGDPRGSVQLCQDIAYNLSCVHGIRHPASLETYLLLSQLYVRAGESRQATDTEQPSRGEYFEKAFWVHVKILRSLTDSASGADHDDEFDPVTAILTKKSLITDSQQGEEEKGKLVDEGARAKTHLRLLKCSYQRLGAWPLLDSEREELYADVAEKFRWEQKNAEEIEKWLADEAAPGKVETIKDTFHKVDSWEIVGDSDLFGLEAKSVTFLDWR